MSQEQFIKAMIKSKVRVEDPEVYEKLVDIIYKFSLVLMYGDTTLRKQAVDALFSVLPEELTLDILTNYVSRTLQRYQKLSQIALSLIPRTARGGNVEDMFIQMALEMFKSQYGNQNLPQTQKQTEKTQEFAQIPEDLKKLLE